MGTHITLLEAIIVSAVSLIAFVFLKTVVQHFFKK